MADQRRHGMGTGGHCVCPKCGKQTLHHRGIPCQEERCPKCGCKNAQGGLLPSPIILEKTQREKHVG